MRKDRQRCCDGTSHTKEAPWPPPSPPIPPLFDEACLAIAGFLVRYSGPTRAACTTDLRQYFSWCADQGLDVFAARRGHLDILSSPSVADSVRLLHHSTWWSTGQPWGIWVLLQQPE